MSDGPDTPSDILQSLEDDVLLDAYQRGDQFKRLASLYAEQGDQSRAREMTTLQYCFHLMASRPSQESPGKRTPRFRPLIEANGKGYPVLEMITEDRWLHVRSWAKRTKNPAMRARLCDLLWVGCRDHAAARDAIDAYMECADSYAQSDEARDLLSLADAVSRSIEVSLRLNDRDRTRRIVDRAESLIHTFVKQDRSRWAFEVVKALLAFRKVRVLLDLSALQQTAEAVLNEVPADAIDRLWERHWLTVLEDIANAKGNDELRHAARVRFAESFEHEGDKLAHLESWMQAAWRYREALSGYRRAGGCPAKMDGILRKLAHATKASQAEMKRVEASVEIPREEMDAYRQQIVALYAEHGIGVLSVDGCCLPDVEQIQRSIEDSRKDFSLHRLFSRVVTDGERIVAEASSEEDKEALDFTRQLLWSLHFRTGHTAAWVFEAVQARGSSVADEVMKFVEGSEIIHSERQPLVRLALERYEVGDYVSCIHVLVFQIEGILRDFAGRMGRPLLFESNGRTQARALDDLLRDETLAPVLGLRRTACMKALLVDQTGPHIRHRIAHGLPSAGLFDKTTADLLIVLLVQLAGFKEKKEEADEH